MLSDCFLIRHNNIENVLDKIEKIAFCYDFKSKELMSIRLLAEEIISMMSPTFALSDGCCKISTDKANFTVIIDCDASVNGLDESTKKQLLKISRSHKNKGFFSMIGKVFEYLSSTDADSSMITGRRMFYSYGPNAMNGGYYWDSEFAYSLARIEQQDSPSQTKSEAPDYGLEISIIEGFADDIHVSLQKSLTGIRLEVAVVKSFRPGQIEGLEIQ